MGDEMEAPQNASIRQTKLSKTGTLIEQAKLSQLRWVSREFYSDGCHVNFTR